MIRQLGDFGLTVFPEPDGEYSYRQRVGYMPPEQLNSRILNPGQRLALGEVLHPTLHPRTPLTSAANVWGMGYVMWVLLTGLATDTTYRGAQSATGQFNDVEKSYRKIIDEDRYSWPLREAIVSNSITIKTL